MINETREACKARAGELTASGRSGDFFIRGGVSSGPPGSLGLSLVVGVGKLENFLIEKTSAGLYQLRQSSATFSSVDDLVVYFSLQQRPPLPVKLNGIEGIDGPGTALYESIDDEDDDVNFGFAGLDLEDEFDVAGGSTSINPRGLSGLQKRVAPGGASAFSVKKIELMRKQAEVLAAKRRAAELNVKLLSQSGNGPREEVSAREREEAETSIRMQQEMANMKNQGLLASWQAQMQQVDQLRSRTRTSAASIKPFDGPDGRSGADYVSPPASEVDGSVHKLYEEIGAYTKSFANKVAEVTAEEKAIQMEEHRILVLDGIVQSVQQTIHHCIDIATVTGELTITKRNAIEEKRRMAAELEEQRTAFQTQLQAQQRKLQEQERVYAETNAALNDRQQRLSMVAEVMGLAPKAAGGRASTSYGYSAYSGGSVVASKPPRGSGAGTSYQPSPAAPRSSTSASGQSWRSGQTVVSATRLPTARPPSVYERIPGDPDSDDDQPLTTSWRNTNKPTRKPFGAPKEQEQEPAFGIVKFKPPVQRDVSSTRATSQDVECTFLGNCTCRNCQ